MQRIVAPLRKGASVFALYFVLGALAFIALFLVCVFVMARDPGIHPADKGKPFHLQRIRVGNPHRHVFWQERWLGWLGLAVPFLILPAITALVLFFDPR